MKNAYLTSHFPLIAIILFSMSFAIYSGTMVIDYLQELGLYSGMIEFFSERGIQLTLLFVLWFLYFMVFAAMKLIADTVNELSLLFFSKDEEGKELQKVRRGSWIFLIFSILSVIAVINGFLLVSVFLAGCVIYFFYFIYKVSESLTTGALFGLIFFHVLFWATFVLAVSYAVLILYNSVIASLPI